MSDIYSRYELNLYYQFLASEGVESVHYQSQAFFKEYKKWLKQYKKILSKYALYIQNLDINLASEKLAEVGKGWNDSIVMYPEYQVISQYAETLGEDTSNLVIIDNKPYISKYDHLKLSKDYKTYMTFNPYFDDDITKWYQLHNGGLNISLGVCGKVYDRDSSKKVKLISDIADKLDCDYEENYDIMGDDYFYNINSKRKIKK